MGEKTLNMPSTPDESERGSRRSFWRRNRWIWWVAGSMFAALMVVAVVLSIVARRFEPFMREQIVVVLQQRFHTHVELADFHVSVHHGQQGEWGMWATGRGLRIWPPHQEGADHPLEVAVGSKPLIDLGEFSFHVPLRYETVQRLHIGEVRLKNLVIDVPPRSDRDKDKQASESARDSSDGPTVPTPQQAPATSEPGGLASLTVDRVVCEGADLTLETDKPDRVPLDFEISHLTLLHVAFGKAMDFRAELTNPKPKGAIETSGSFGPWVVADPGESAVNGKYRFEHADLSVFNGIAGLLSSNGTYAGSLRQMAVDGESDVPDFRLTSFGNAVPLHVRFHARVDGMDGDTWLEPVDATLGSSHFTTRGKVVLLVTPPGGGQPAAVNTASASQIPGKPAAGKQVGASPVPADTRSILAQQGRLIDLKVVIDRGNLNDFTRLVNRSSTSMLTGDVSATATLHLPPGADPVQLRMKLDGHFKLTDAQFTSPKIQDRVEELSLRGQGRPGELKTTDSKTIRSEMEGSFHVDHGVIALPDLHYGVPGADVTVNGTYAMDGKLKFEGMARMEATVSKMVGGWKGFLLKPADRFFRKDGSGTLVPIHIRGSRDAPEVGIDFNRMKQTSPEKPGDKQQ